MKQILIQWGIETAILIGAIVGTILALKKSNEKWYQRFPKVGTSILSSIYLTPLACSFLNIQEDKLRTGIAVLIAYGGLGFIEKLLDIIIKKIDDGNTK